MKVTRIYMMQDGDHGVASGVLTWKGDVDLKTSCIGFHTENAVLQH